MSELRDFLDRLPDLDTEFPGLRSWPNRLLMEIECITSLRDAPLSDPDQPPTPREHASEQVAP